MKFFNFLFNNCHWEVIEKENKDKDYEIINKINKLWVFYEEPYSFICIIFLIVISIYISIIANCCLIYILDSILIMLYAFCKIKIFFINKYFYKNGIDKEVFNWFYSFYYDN